MAAAILHFLSPRAPKVLSPVCTLTQSTSSMTISVKHDESLFIQAPKATYILPYSRRCLNSNQRTKNQFRPRNATKGTTSYQLRQYAEATLGGGSLRKIVKLPEGEDENEWLAVNSKDAFTSCIVHSLPRFSGGFLQSYQPSVRIDHRVLLPTIVSRDEGYGRVCQDVRYIRKRTLIRHAGSSTFGRIPRTTRDPPKCQRRPTSSI
jgi:hypothetical protein